MSRFEAGSSRRGAPLAAVSIVSCIVTNFSCSPAPGGGAVAAGGSNVGAGGSSVAPVPSGGTLGGGVGGAGAPTGGLNENATGGSTAGTGGSPGGGAVGGGVGGGGATGGAAVGGAPSTGGTASTDTVQRTASKFSFQHFPVVTSATGVWNGPETAGMTPITTSYDTVVLENGYLKVTLLPDYGGRILSIVHKPTDRELLYQNPIGTPYLMKQDIFYYDYLVIMGGIFPSFPEPEHGRYWNQPYQLEIVNESSDAITVRMSRKDDQDIVQGVPTRYDVGRTDLLVELDVTLRAGRSNLELTTKLTNTRAAALPKFEYWTITTLAPGSTPGDTKIPENTRILAKMDQVHLLESSWSWFGDAEARVSGEVFQWKNLSYFTNWVDQGTAFANPKYQANHSGLINYDSNAGILRVSDNIETPGLKLWTFGKGSLKADINDSTEWLRPTIEMWHGVTPEFWDRASMAAGAVKTWTDRYMPTFGIKDITAASEYGALQLSSVVSGADTVLSAIATLTLPDQTVHAVLRLGESVIAEKDVVISPAVPNTLEVTVPSSSIPTGARLEAEFFQGEKSLLSGEISLP